MNHINLFCVVAIGCFLIAPTLSLPANDKAALENFEPEADSSSRESITVPANDKDNEINSNVDDDSEIIGNPGIDYEGNTDVEKPTNFEGHSTGIITRIGFDGPFKCRNYTCPAETNTCMFTSTIRKDDKIADVVYTCRALNGTVLSNETVVESAKDLATYDGLDFSQFFGDLQSRMRNMFKNVFSHPFFGADDDFPDFGQK